MIEKFARFMNLSLPSVYSVYFNTETESRVITTAATMSHSWMLASLKGNLPIKYHGRYAYRHCDSLIYGFKSNSLIKTQAIQSSK